MSLYDAFPVREATGGKPDKLTRDERKKGRGGGAAVFLARVHRLFRLSGAPKAFESVNNRQRGKRTQRPKPVLRHPKT